MVVTIFIVKLNYLGAVMLKFCIRTVCLLTASLIGTQALSQDMSGWSDKTICRLAKATPDNVEYGAELTSRGLTCGEAVTSSSTANSNTKAVEHKLNTDIDDWHEFDTSIVGIYKDKTTPQPRNYVSLYDGVDPYGRTFSSSVIPERWTNLKTPLMDIKIPENWKLIDDYDKYQKIISRNTSPRLGGPANNPFPSDCIDMFHNFQTESGVQNAVSNDLRPGDCLRDLRVRLYEGEKLDGIKWTNGKEHVLNMLENMAKDDLRQPKDGGIGAKNYDYFTTLNYAAGIYAQEKDNMDFSDTFKIWLTTRLLNVELRNFGVNDTVQPRCRQVDFFTWGNDCSTTRFIYTEAQLIGGLALGNQTIFEEGIDSLQYITSLFDDKNIYPLWASRGIRAMAYHNQIPNWLTNYAVILNTVGYDFMEHEMPNGSKVHESIKFSFDHVWEDDLSIFWPYIQINNGTSGDWAFAELLKPMHLRLGHSGYLPTKPQRVVRQALLYVDKYQPELKDTFGYEEVYSKWVLGTRDFSSAYKGTPGNYAMYNVASPLDMHSIYKASDNIFLAEQ